MNTNVCVRPATQAKTVMLMSMNACLHHVKMEVQLMTMIDQNDADDIMMITFSF